METRTETYDGVTVEFCRMQPATMFAFSALYRKSTAYEKGIDSEERGKRVSTWLQENPDVHKILFERAFPESIVAIQYPVVDNEKGQSWKRQPGRNGATEPCVTNSPEKGAKFYLGDLGVSRVVSLSVDLMGFTQEAEGPFRDAGSDGEEPASEDSTPSESDGTET